MLVNFRLIAGLIYLLGSIARWFEKEKMKQEAKAEVIAEIKQEEEKLSEEAADIINKPDNGDVDERLRHGTF